MPVYNGEQHLDIAIQSVLDQTFPDFELLIMDDGSTDRTPQILEHFAKKDPRIKLFYQKNSGVVQSSNALIAHAKAELISRLDADDMISPECLKLQFDHMQKNPKTVLLGTVCRYYQPDGTQTETSTTFSEDFLNRWFLTYNCAFLQISLMFRKTVFDACSHYLESEYPAEDYGLWIRMKKHGHIENLKNILGVYRINPEGISRKNFHQQIEIRNRLNRKNFEDIYQAHEIPDLKKVDKALLDYKLSHNQKELLGKLACLTGCFLIEKGEIKRAIEYFLWSFNISKKRLDALANLILAHTKRAMYISIDVNVRKKQRTIKPQIHWYKPE